MASASNSDDLSRPLPMQTRFPGRCVGSQSRTAAAFRIGPAIVPSYRNHRAKQNLHLTETRILFENNRLKKSGWGVHPLERSLCV